MADIIVRRREVGGRGAGLGHFRGTNSNVYRGAYPEYFGNLGIWPFDSDSSEDETITDRLGKLKDQLLMVRTTLLKKAELGKATSSDYAKFDKFAENYNLLVRNAAVAFKEKDISYGGQFTFLKTSKMEDFATLCCWTKTFSKSSETGLAGFGALGDFKWEYVAGAIIVLNPTLWPAAAITVALLKVLPKSWFDLFNSTSSGSAAFGKTMAEQMAKDLKAQVDAGTLTPEEALMKMALTEAQFNNMLSKLGLEEDKGSISESIGKVVLWVGGALAIGGLAYAGVKIYKTLKPSVRIGGLGTVGAVPQRNKFASAASSCKGRSRPEFLRCMRDRLVG